MTLGLSNISQVIAMIIQNICTMPYFVLAYNSTYPSEKSCNGNNILNDTIFLIVTATKNLRK